MVSCQFWRARRCFCAAVQGIAFFRLSFAPDSAKWSPQHIRKSVKESIRKHVLATPDIDLDFIAYLIRAQGPHMFTRKWYGEIFERAAAGQKVLDVTPEYCCISDEGVEFVEKFLPSTQFLYFVRDPVERAISQIRMNLKRKAKLPETRAEWLWASETAGDRGARRLRHLCSTLERRIWRRSVAVHALRHDRGGARRFYGAVETFLGMPPAAYPNAAKKVHWAADIEIPEFVREYLAEATQPQRAFLRSRVWAASSARRSSPPPPRQACGRWYSSRFSPGPMRSITANRPGRGKRRQHPVPGAAQQIDALARRA